MREKKKVLREILSGDKLFESSSYQKHSSHYHTCLGMCCARIWYMYALLLKLRMIIE